MGFLDGKGWMAQEFYNEYLGLKTKISELIGHQEYYINTRREDAVQAYQVEIDELVDRLKFVLEQMRMNGIKMEELILLSIGVDV